MGAQKSPARNLRAGRLMSALMRACSCALVVGAARLPAEAGDDAVLYPDLAIPIAASGYDIETVTRVYEGRRAVHYCVASPFPAEDIVAFYHARLKSDGGWTLNQDESAGGWFDFADGLGEETACVQQRFLAWDQVETRVRLFLALRYTTASEKCGEALGVSAQLQPIVDFAPLKAFLDRLAGEGKRASFLELVDEYRGPDGRADLEQAIREHGDLPELREFQELRLQAEKEVQAIVAHAGRSATRQ